MSASVLLTKSLKGLAELAGGNFELDLRSRQILILADGQCSLEYMQQLRPNLDVAGIAKRLLTEGYLVTQGSELSTSTPKAKTPPAASTIEPDRLAKARAIMTESTRTYIGILGTELLRKTGEAQTAVEIKKCIAQWHMALRESRLGRAVADEQLHEVYRLLEFELN